MILGVLLAADMWLCDPHGLCSMQHDYVGIGDKPWPSGENRRPLSKDKPGTPHRRCKLGDKNWNNDCR